MRRSIEHEIRWSDSAIAIAPSPSPLPRRARSRDGGDDLAPACPEHLAVVDDETPDLTRRVHAGISSQDLRPAADWAMDPKRAPHDSTRSAVPRPPPIRSAAPPIPSSRHRRTMLRPRRPPEGRSPMPERASRRSRSPRRPRSTQPLRRRLLREHSAWVCRPVPGPARLRGDAPDRVGRPSSVRTDGWSPCESSRSSSSAR